MLFRTLEATEKPYKAVVADKPDIPRKPKKATPPETNGGSKANGIVHDEATRGVKRSNDDGEEQPLKKFKTARTETEDDVVLVEDGGGAIVIDD